MFFKMAYNVIYIMSHIICMSICYAYAHMSYIQTYHIVFIARYVLCLFTTYAFTHITCFIRQYIICLCVCEHNNSLSHVLPACMCAVFLSGYMSCHAT
jgi:hypothetical protein